MHHTQRQRQRLTALTLTASLLILAMLACTSNDSLFIKLTSTPVPTNTPAPLVGVATKYKVNDQLYAVDAQRIINLGAQAGDRGGTIGAGFLNCFRDTQITVLDFARSTLDPTDPTMYYKVDCGSGGQGWLPEYKLTPYNPSGGTAIIKSPDGKGAPLYSDSSTKAKLASDKPCPDGTKVQLNDASRNVDNASKVEDTAIYFQVQCGDVTGWIVDSMLVPAS